MATATQIPGMVPAAVGGQPPEQKVNDGSVAPREYGDPKKQAQSEYGPNNEKLEQLKPQLTMALWQLVRSYYQEAIVGRRHEIRKIKQARLFWQGLQYLFGWDADNMQWRMPFGSAGSGTGLSIDTDKDLVEGSRYQFVTNFYQAFGLSFISVLSQDIPAVIWSPQSAQSEEDLVFAKAADDVAERVIENNNAEELLKAIGFYLWCDGIVAAYVRYVADGQRFGFKDQPQMELADVAMGVDSFVCDWCQAETPADQMQFMTCLNCGHGMGEANFQKAPTVKMPRVTAMRKVAKGQEVISIYGGLECYRPIYIDDPVNDGAFIGLQQEVHEAKLRASFPHVKDKILSGSPADAEDVYARSSRLSVKQGLPTTHPGDALRSLTTFSQYWIEPWAFYTEELKDEVREELLKLFPNGCYVAFAGQQYCESRNESKRDHWRVLQPMPGDGQNRPAVGSSLISVQERYNILSNTMQEKAEFSIPPIYADPQVLDFDAVADQTAEPGAHYPARARPGQPLEAGFYQPQSAELPADVLKSMDDMFGTIGQFLTGIQAAVFGGAIAGSKTAEEYSMARDQALGRLGLYWRGVKWFWAETMKLGVECFRANRTDDDEQAVLGEDGEYESKVISIADLKGNVNARPEADETFPRLKSQQRSLLQQMLVGAEANPLLQEIVAEPANQETISRDLGLKDLVFPGKDSRDKQLREIKMLLQMPPQIAAVPGPDGIPVPQLKSAVPIDDLDRHEVEFEECKRWVNSEAGQKAKMENPAGFANVKAHAMEHQAQIQKAAQNKPPSESMNFKDMPVSGKVQMAAQGGIQLDPMELMVKDAQDRQDKKDELQAKLNSRPAAAEKKEKAA